MSTKILAKDVRVASFPWQHQGAELPPDLVAAAAPAGPPPPPPAPVPVASAAEVELARLRDSLPRELHAARQAGFQAGHHAAEQQMQDRYDNVILRVTRSIDEIGQARARFRREAEEDVVRLALAIARRILHREITIHPGALQGLVKAALETLESREICAIRLHPSLLPDLQRAQEQVGSPQPWNWTPDPSLEIGAVFVDTTRGQLDASIESQLNEIERGFADYLPTKL